MIEITTLNPNQEVKNSFEPPFSLKIAHLVENPRPQGDENQAIKFRNGHEKQAIKFRNGPEKQAIKFRNGPEKQARKF